MGHATPRLLKNAPITEAVIDIRGVLGVPFTPVVLEKVRTELSPLFPQVEEQRRVEAIMQVIEGRFSTSATDDGVRRLILRSRDRAEAIVVGAEGFSFSKLRPYTSWDAVFGAAQRFWEIYRKILRVIRVQRIAVRYINHFNIPRSVPIGSYLTAPPALPETVVPESVTSALLRLSLRDERSRIESTVIQVTEPVEVGTTVMIDIDSFRSGDFDPSSSDYWELFAELRATKNRIFFGSIHESAAEAFDR